MKANKELLTVLLMIILVDIVFLINSCKNRQTTGVVTSGNQSKIGKKAPEFTSTSYDGKAVKLSDYNGKIVVLEWLNYECPFVKYHYEQAKTMTDLFKKYKDENVIWLAINSTAHQTTEKNREFAQKHEIGYPILDDRAGKIGRAYGAKTTPHMFIIDSEGIIAYAGAIDNSPLGKVEENVINYVDRALDELVSGKPVGISSVESYGCSVKYAN